MKLAYQGPETTTTGDLRVYEMDDGSIHEVRSQRRQHRVFALEVDFEENPELWYEIAKKLVTEDILRVNGEPYGEHEVKMVENYAAYGRDSQQKAGDLVAIDAYQLFWPEVEVD